MGSEMCIRDRYSPSGFAGQRVSRFTLLDGKLDMKSEQVLLEFEEQRFECCHHAGSLQFGPDGNLFIGTGDNTNPFGDAKGCAPLDERKERCAWDAQRSAANTASLSGKILRIRPTESGYEIPEGNLFPADENEGRPEIYVMGCRNPWRLSVDQKTGHVFWGDVGPDASNDSERGPRGYDEVNRATGPGNFGWPHFIADNQAYAHVDFATGKIGDFFDPVRPINNSPNNTGSKVLPRPEPAYLYYPYDKSAPFSEFGEGRRTAGAGPVYHFNDTNRSQTKFPRYFDNALFIFDWSRHWIKVVHLGRRIRVEPFMSDHKFQRPTDIEFGPDGAMYLIEYGETWGENADAKIVRIEYVHGNRAPNAIAKAKNNVGVGPLAVEFSSDQSFDKDGDDLTFEWVRVDDSAIGESSKRTTLSTQPNPTVVFDQPTVTNVELIVRDGEGLKSSAFVPVMVGNAPPEINILGADGNFFDPGRPIEYEIIINDLEDGTNDSDLCDQEDLMEIESDSATRVSMNVRRVKGKFSTNSELIEPGLQLMKQSDCFNCHDLHTKRVGPSLVDIANKYRLIPSAIEKSVDRVLNGSVGVWGKVPMIAHNQHHEPEVYSMVQWIFGLGESQDLKVSRGFVGEIDTDEHFSGGLLLDASYTDAGAGIIPPATSTARRHLRSRYLEAEHANEIGGAAVMDIETANNGQFVGGVDRDYFLRLDSINTNAIGKVTCRVGWGGAAGWIEFRKGTIDGHVMARVRIDAIGRGGWRDESADFTPMRASDDLYIVFVNERQELINLDSIYFHSRTEHIASPTGVSPGIGTAQLD